MFHSLRARLLVSYLVVIVLTLCSAGAGLLVLLQDYQRGIVTQRLTDAVGPASVQARQSLQRGLSMNTVANQIQEQVEPSWRVLFIDDQGLILADSQNEFLNRRLPRVVALQNLGRLKLATGRQFLEGRELVFVAVPVGRPVETQTFLMLATIVRPIIGGLEDLARPLLLAGALAFLVAILLALLMARSIAQPLGHLTRASEAMARGKYDESIPVRGNDEVARLAASFNLMMQAVKRSQQAQKDFVANVSHELKTPLTSIQGFSQAIMEGATRNAESAQYAAQLIFEESQRMARLVADLLTLARLDTREIAAEQQTLDLNTMLPAWVERFRARANQAHIALTLTLAEPPLILGDAGRLEQVLSNLLDNALKYTRAGGRVNIYAGAEMHALASANAKRQVQVPCALLRVEDTGEGIPAASVPRLIERFYRVDAARAAGGSGLGLSIVQEIVRGHHGEIQVESQENIGTTFRIWLPAKT